MGTKPGLKNVAALAGVGIATVDRVLNERGGVSVATSHKVLNAARQLGLRRHLPEEHSTPFQIEVLLSATDTYFFTQLSHYFSRFAGNFGYRRMVVHRTLIPESAPLKMAQQIRQCATSRHGVIVFAQDHPQIHQALSACHEQQVAVITLATDLPGVERLCHVGINQYQAGRVAGRLMSNMLPESGQLLMVSGHMDYLAHRQRIAGFREVIQQRRPQMSLEDVLAGEDLSPKIEQLLQQKLTQCHNVCGIYNSGDRNQNISEVLAKFGLAGQIAFITHELYDTTRRLLQQDILSYTIDQNPELQAFRALDLMINYLEKQNIPGMYDSGNIELSIFTPENCDSPSDS
ncbi:LacI family DNA-binding transcriptional regulator [Tatumella citrea]|uniref:Transcriptional regulator n=1 Tax=Tatumella citrea TaxID=53336 RepID=A0A1Y0LCR5_TATCI|nr:LacI family DNA-binding transcriptional regulator [Tatumella citrea]ARU95864.1 transcriptional regulator [Tatumella citrea]ARU99904.1 transcriptional regulator [Tatumella citrea]